MRLAVGEIERLCGSRLSWREALAGGPPWLTWELYATESARDRLARWIDAGGLERSQPTRTEIEASLCYLGDPAVMRFVLDVLERLPAVVVDHLVCSTEIYGVGRDTAGWVSAAPPRAVQGPDDEASTIMVLDGHRDDQALAAVVAHETAHCWLEPRPRVADNPSPGARLEGLRAAGALAREWGTSLPRITFDRVATAEKRAVALAAAWGYPGNADVCARHAVQFLAARIAS